MTISDLEAGGLVSVFGSEQSQTAEPEEPQFSGHLGALIDEGPTSAEPQEAAPCDEPSDVSDSQVCFEEAGAPVSTRPEFMARVAAMRASSKVAESTQEIVVAQMLESGDDVSRDEPLDRMPTAELVRSFDDVPQPYKPEPSCSVNPDECHSLPPLPSGLNLELGASSARSISHDVSSLLPPAPPLPFQPVGTDTNIRPQPEHRSPPDPPPRVGRA